MDNNSSKNDSEQGEEEEDTGFKRASHDGKSRYYRGDNESFEDRLKRKNEVKPDKVRSVLKSGGRLRPVSIKQGKKNNAYTKAKKAFYKDEDNQKCFLCGSVSNLSIHHKEKRGNNISDESTFVTLCLMGDYMNNKFPNSNSACGCHAWVESNKSIAREMGLIL